MGAWGILERQSDNGLDLLSVIVAEHLRKVDFATFNVSEAIRLVNQFTENEIEKYRQEPPSGLTEWYINEVLMHDFTHAALLVAECLSDYYQTGELVIIDYVGENYEPEEHHITDFTVTGTELQPLLDELQKVQDPEHWLYQCWVSEETRQRWLKHIRSVYQTLSEHT